MASFVDLTKSYAHLKTLAGSGFSVIILRIGAETYKMAVASPFRTTCWLMTSEFVVPL
ncbi:MAG: hypothetical protein AABY64_06160 [Bdellovibrionota bacterium]